jgi:hypothetical protein
MLEAPPAGSNFDEGWPHDFEVTSSGCVEVGLRVSSRSGKISGRTTGGRMKCSSNGCPGWFIGVRWETGQMMFPCSEGWKYEAATGSIAITGGGEISARVVSPEPLGIDPLPPEQWPSRVSLTRLTGWRSEDRDPSE